MTHNEGGSFVRGGVCAQKTVRRGRDVESDLVDHRRSRRGLPRLGAASLVATLLIVLAVIGAPVAGYLMLDPSQRRRLARIRDRRQIDR